MSGAKVTCFETAGHRPWVELPAWLPDAAKHYLLHTSVGLSIRALARDGGVHPSTILRQVRRIEAARDDALIDAALARVSARHLADAAVSGATDTDDGGEDCFLALRRLSDRGAVLVWSAGMDRALIARDAVPGETLHSTIVAAQLAERFALCGWIVATDEGRVARYAITQAGRTALRELVTGTCPAQAEAPQRALLSVSETPLNALSRRRNRDGVPFLSGDLVHAGERLREDFELSVVGRPGGAEDAFERVLDTLATPQNTDEIRGRARARSTLAAALETLGPGLGDAALRCCCFLEGLEETERLMGWSARSGKVVLRIALERLSRHYKGAKDSDQLIG